MLTDSLTVPVLLRRQGRERAEHPLLICDDDRVDYAEAARRSARLARGLIALGAGKGSHIGLLYPNGSQFVVGVLAAARIGAVTIPFSTFVTAEELGTQLRDADVSILLAARTYRSHDYVRRVTAAIEVQQSEFDVDTPIYTTRAPVLRHIVFDDERLSRRPDSVPEARLAALEQDVHPGDPLAIIYTSGSTGAPKGAVHTHGALLAHQENLNTIRGLRATDRLFCNSPFFWIGGFAFGLLATLVAGATLICSNSTDPAATLDLLETEKPNITNGFVAAIIPLTQDPSFADRDLSTLRRGNLYPLMAAEVRPDDPALRHGMLGMTEGGSVVLIDGDESDQPESRRGSYGRPAPGFETKVIDPDTGAEVLPGMVGELCLRGPYLMQRYYGRSREDCFDADDWFHTGDLVRTDAEGYFYFLGRAGAMIKTAGANVTPGEVEGALTDVLADMGVEARVHVVGLPDPVRGQLVAAMVVSDEAIALDEPAIRGALRDTLSAYKIPRRFHICRPSELPVLSSGKVDLAALTRMFDD